VKLGWDRFGAQLGVLFCVAGAVVMWAGYNGAASYDDVPSQFPYLISGGIAGLSLVVVGVGLFVTQTTRAERATLEAGLDEIRQAVERLNSGGTAVAATAPSAPGPMVVAGKSSYHRPDCKVLEGRDGLKTMTRSAAVADGLEPCRTCAAGD
jgi:hypothetical protein